MNNNCLNNTRLNNARMKKNSNEKKYASLFTVLGTVIFLHSSFAINSAFGAEQQYLTPDKVTAPPDNALTKTRIELGKKLFFDPRLSGSNWISCGTCHNPALGWSDGLKTAIGNGQQILGRNTPTIINVAFNKHQFWDGRAKTLEEQALGPIQAEGEMNQNLDELVKELKAIPGYQSQFKKAYPKEGITRQTIGKAIASFERTIVSKDSPFEQYLKGNKKALSTAQVRGFNLFEGKARCATCHSGFNFTDDKFHNIGLKSSNDKGRFAITKNNKMIGAMKTPTLRDVSLTGPYMHNGEYKTLEEVVEHYNRGGDKKEGLSPLMKKLDLSKREKSDLVAFLSSLTGKPQKIIIPRLPN